MASRTQRGRRGLFPAALVSYLCCPILTWGPGSAWQHKSWSWELMEIMEEMRKRRV